MKGHQSGHFTLRIAGHTGCEKPLQNQQYQREDGLVVGGCNLLL